MATKKIYPFITAEGINMENDGHRVVTFDAREVESYKYWRTDENKIEEKQLVEVNFKSGNRIRLELELDQELYPGDNLITRIDMVQYSHFWHDNEDSLPDEDEE